MSNVGVDLPNPLFVKPLMELKCAYCNWRPPGNMTMGEFDLHLRLDHEGIEAKMELVAVCPCGSVMGFQHARPTGGGFKDWFVCPSCHASGFVRRDDNKV